MSKKLNLIFLFVVIFTILISLLFTPTLILYPEAYGKSNLDESYIFDLNNSEFLWPIPGYTRITSYFGKRKAPTSGASTFHTGMDIGAPEGSTLIATIDGKITFTGFLGGGGYTITLTHDNIKITYCHVSPNYIVSVGDFVHRGDIIGNVGPKYVYDVPGNTYTDSTGRPTNGATTGTHLHLGFRVNDEYANPLDFYNIKKDI